MRNNEKFSGDIDSTSTLLDMNRVEKIYYDKNGEITSPKSLNTATIVYKRPGFSEDDSRLNDKVNKLSKGRTDQEDLLIFNLSQLYGKKDGKYLSKVLENVETDEYDFYNKKYDDLPGYGYLEYLKKHNSLEDDEEFYKFAQWYDYAFSRYAREKFLPAARQYETKYADSIQTQIQLGLLPKSAIGKLEPIKTHTIDYSLVDAFNKQDIGGSCAPQLFDDDKPRITYHAEFGLDDEENRLQHYNSQVNDFRHVLCHELTHLLVKDLFGAYIPQKERTEKYGLFSSVRAELSKIYTESQIDTIEEADRIITEGITEWLSQIINNEADETRVDTKYGTYHSERQVIDSLLNDGLEEIPAKELLLLCAAPGEELEANRDRIFGLLYEAYPDCQTKIDIAEKIVERFNWTEYQNTHSL